MKSPYALGKRFPVTRIAQATAGGRPTREGLLSALPDWQGPIGDDGNPQKRRPLNTVPNVIGLALLDGWVLRYNVMTKRTELSKVGLLAPRADFDNAALALFGDLAVRCGMTRTGLMELVDAAAGQNQYHPALEWIKATPHGGVSRRELFHSSLELADPSKAPLRAKLMDAWAFQLIGALLEPNGIAAQGVLVLAGPQGVNKTRWVANLCSVLGAVRTGLHLDPTNKDSVTAATGAWISELGELDTTQRRADVGALKAFLTNNEDVIRRPYAQRENIYLRRTGFVGTVNELGFLVDDTGNRRFWVLEVVQCHLLPANHMQQVWAEYLALYEAGQRWYLDAETQAELNASNIDHTAVDPLRERIAVRFDWDSVTWGTVDPDNWQAFTQVHWLSATDVCMAVGIDRPNRAETTRVGAIIRDLHRVSAKGITRAIHRKSNGSKLLAVPAVRLRGV